MRATLSPSFTSSKMKMMFSLISECADNFTNYFGNVVTSSSVLEIDVKDTITRFTNDVIATSAFGIKCDSLKDKENDFFINSTKAMKFSGLKNMLRFIVLGSLPKLARVSLILTVFVIGCYLFAIISIIRFQYSIPIFTHNMLSHWL